VATNLAISSMHLKSKQEAETNLKKERLKFEEELKKAQMAVVASNAKLEESLNINKSNEIKKIEKDNALSLMELKISEMKNVLDVSKKECFPGE